MAVGGLKWGSQTAMDRESRHEGIRMWRTLDRLERVPSEWIKTQIQSREEDVDFEMMVKELNLALVRQSDDEEEGTRNQGPLGWPSGWQLTGPLRSLFSSTLLLLSYVSLSFRLLPTCGHLADGLHLRLWNGMEYRLARPHTLTIGHLSPAARFSSFLFLSFWVISMGFIYTPPSFLQIYPALSIRPIKYALNLIMKIKVKELSMAAPNSWMKLVKWCPIEERTVVHRSWHNNKDPRKSVENSSDVLSKLDDLLDDGDTIGCCWSS